MSDTITEETKSQTMGEEKSMSHLQEVTMDPNFSISCNSSAVQGSPSQGRTMKDYEEQLSSLKKENFNLKLNVYFLEERLYSSSHIPASQDSILKKNIELKVNLEAIRRELNEKQDLLITAARALELMETSGARKEAELLSQISSMENEIQRLRDGAENDNVMMGVDDSVALYAAAFNLKPSEMPEKKNDASCECHQLRALLTVERENVVSLRDTITAKEQQISEQREQILELINKEDVPLLKNESILERKDEDLKDDKINHQLERLQQENLNACQIIQSCLNRIKQMERENKKIKQVLQQKEEIISKHNSEESLDSSLHKYKALLKARDNRINELESKLQNVCAFNDDSKISCHSDNKELNWLNSHLEQKINTLRDSVYVKMDKIDYVTPDTESETTTDKLSMNIQQMLVNRLQEMTYFFDSLLSKRCIIGEEKKRKIENILEQTIDLSVGLKVDPKAALVLEESLLGSCGKPSQTLKLENLTAIFGHHLSIDNTHEYIKYENLEDIEEQTTSDTSNKKQSSIVKSCHNSDSTVGVSSGKIKRETRKAKARNSNRQLNSTWHGVNATHFDQSESECWSEPDRLVSLARMGGPIDNSVKGSTSSGEEMCQYCQKNVHNPSKSPSLDLTESKHFDNMDRELKMLMGVKAKLQNLLEGAYRQIEILENRLEDNVSKHSYDLEMKQTEINNLTEEMKQYVLKHQETIDNFNIQINHLKEQLNKSDDKATQLEKDVKSEQEKYENGQKLHKEEIKQVMESADTKVKEMQDKIEINWVSRVRYEALRKELDHGALQASQAMIDKTAAMEQKIRSDNEAERYRNLLSEARTRMDELKSLNGDFQNRIASLESWHTNGERALSSSSHNSSPGASSSDLGIEGDRLSIVELIESSNENYNASNLAAENVALREKLEYTQRALEKALQQPLKYEQGMCKEIHKTLQLLRQVRSNLNNK